MLNKKKGKHRRQQEAAADKRFRYSIRKFNVGVASVAIAAFMFLGGGAAVSADDTAVSEPQTVASSTGDSSSATSEAQTATSTEATSTASEASTSTEATAATSESAAASTEATSTASEASTSTEATAATSESAATSTEATSTASSEATSTTASTPTTVEEAKTVLEQVISEAEVLSQEASRQAASSTEDASALQTAAQATKVVVTEATATFNDSLATLEAVNAQINAVRTNVEALVLELRKYYPDGEITAVLDTATGTPAATTIETTNPASVSYAQHGVWEIPDPVKAANSGLTAAEREATITVVEKNYPAGYIGDQDANRDTFLIFNFDTVGGYGDGKNFNDWAGHNYYMTFSVSTDSAERAASDVVYAKLVEKTMNGDRVVKTVELKPNVKTVVDELNVLENYPTHRVKYDFTYIVSENGDTTRQISIYNSNGANWNTAVYNKLDQTRVNVNTNSFSTTVPSGTIQTTSYYVKENAATGRLRELLARYTQDSGLVGDAFHIAGAIDFDNYELIESELPKVVSGILTTDYKVGTQYAVFRGNWNEARLYTITDINGALQMQVYMLDPNNPDWANFYKTKMNNSGTVSDLDDYFTLMFTTEEMQPGGTYNTKPGTFTSKFYDANKLVLEGKQVQVLDSNGDVLGTLNDAKTSYTTATGQIVNVKSVTDTMVTDEDGTVHTVNTKKIYKTDAAGNYVDADGNVLTPIKWNVDAPYRNGKIVDGYGTDRKFDTDSVTVSTGPLDATNTNALWKFGWNYKTPDISDANVDRGGDDRWELGGLEMTLSNSNVKNEQNARYFYTEKGGVDVYYVDTEGNILKDMVTVVGHGDTGSEYNTAAVRDDSIVAADGTVYYYKEIDTTAANLHPVVDDKTDTDYRSNEKIDAEKGTIKSDTVKQLTYVYEKAGNVNINYVDTEGTPLQASVADVTDGKPGSDYDTVVDNKPTTITTADGKTYQLVPAGTYNVGTVGEGNNLTAVGNGTATGIDDTTGTVESGVTKEITYVYQEVKGNVIVHYVDQDGNPISGTTDEGKKTASTVTDTPESSTGTPYDTKDLKPKTITTDDGKIYKLVPAATQGNETGKVVVGTTEITYVYELVQGDVIVHYVDTEGNTIADDVTDQTITDTGTDYDTRDNKPEKITNDQTGEVYYILPKDEVKAGDKETGKVVEGTTEVTYIYEKAGSVNVNYVDTEGNVLKAPVADVTDGKPGSAYDTVLDNKLASISVDGKLYRLVPAGTYNVGTVSNDNNLTAVGNGKATGIDATTGTVEAGKTKEITYVYEEVKGDVVVEYYDTEGNTIAKTEVDTPTTSVDTPYETYDHKPATITVVEKDGSETLYYYKEVKDTSAPEKGDVVEGTTTVQYVYEKAGNVNVNYVDTEGNVIQAKVADVTDGKPDSAYATTDHKPEEITTADGKTYRLVAKEKAGDYPVGTVSDEGNLTAVGNGTATGVDSETGTVEAGKTKEITYVYEEVKGDVIVHYVDTEGNPISGTTDEGKQTASTVTDTPESSTGTPYDTTDLKPKEITTDEGKTYRIVPTLTKGNETGDVVEGTTEITYVYEEVKGDVVVEYYDTDGNVIATTVVDTPDSSVGTPYNTLDQKPATITTADGTVYYYKEVKSTSAAEDGTVVEGTTTVQYVYEKAGSVNVNYVDTDGNPIQAPVADETNEKAGTEYTTADNKPTTITTADGKTYKLVPAGTYNVGTVSDDNNLTSVGNGTATGVDSTTGTVEAGTTKEITYVYEEVKGNVVVNYITTDGTVIKQPVEDTPSTSTGTPYDTTDNKPTTITTEDGKTYRIVPTLTQGNETGDVVEGTTSITYVYEEVKGDVVVEYYDTEGNLISGLSDSGEAVDTKEVDTPSTSTGTAYNTDEDHKPNTITTADGTVYYYKEVKDTSASTTGEVVEGTTTVQYVYEKAGNVIVHYITEDGTVIKATVTDEENAEPGKSYTTTDNKPTEIVTEDGSRYVLIPSKTIGTENGTVEGGKTIEITYVYKKVANWIPQIPGVPAGEEPKVPYPFDPTNPDVPVTPTPDTVIPNVPGFTPVDPKTNEPLKPVDPTDPGKGYVPPTPEDSGVDTPIPYVQNGNVVVNYVTEDGTVIKTPVKDETDAPAGKSYDTTDNKPTEIVTEDGSRYVLIPSKTIGTENGTVEGGKTIEITYVYKKVANWIPQIPGVPAGEEPKVPYPFDPTNPDVPVTPTPDTVIPNVPGFTPVDPKTNEPLKPVDPTDPGKGYVPPTPEDSGVDTPIPYVQNGNVVVNYVTEDGTVIKTPVNDETDAPAGKSYDTTDNKPNTITTEDGTTYELVRVEGSETGTVVGGKTTEVTYVYRKVETPKSVVTNHVDEDGNPIAPQEDGTTPNKGTSIPGYEFTGKTITDENGNTTHIYRKVETPAKKVVTNHVDEDGNPIAPQEDGTTPNKSIPGYEFTGKTVTDPDGNTTHIYRKVVTPIDPTDPVTPVDPKAPVQPGVPAKPEAPAKPTYVAETLPNTGEDNSASVAAMGASMILASLGLAAKRRRKED